VLTFAAVLADRLRRDPGRPLVTFYDDETGERVELSVTTYANWVAKAGSLLVDELGLERGDTVRVDLPPHWLIPVFLGAAWTAGLVVTDADEPAAVVCGPDQLDHWAGDAAERVVLACSLLPLGVRFASPLPAGVHDVGIEIWSQPDAFTPWDPPTADDRAVESWSRGSLPDASSLGSSGQAPQHLNQRQLWEAAAAGNLVSDGGRLLVAASPASPPELATFTEPLAKGGSLVLVTRAGADRLDAINVAEQATARFPA
jgi:uncharacterized protein (TIGR03089 family)